MFTTIFLLITAHMLGDYVFQNDFLANYKAKSNFILFVHSWIWAACIGFAFVFSGYEFSIFDCVYLLIGHFYIDKYKCIKVDKTKALTTDLYIDQALHFVDVAILLAFKIFI